MASAGLTMAQQVKEVFGRPKPAEATVVAKAEPKTEVKDTAKLKEGPPDFYMG
jgi:hypothetical protein